MPEIEWHAELPSTNEMALELARAGAPHGTAIAARRQSAGRGRGQRKWASPAGGLYISIVVRPNLDRERWGLLPLATGLGAGKAVERLTREAGQPMKVGLKWPNDLIINGRKLGGILCHGSSGEYGVLGIGINVNTLPVHIDHEMPHRPTSLRAETGLSNELEVVARKVYDEVMAQMTRLERNADSLLADYRSRCITIHRKVRWADGEGQAVSISAHGGLVVRDLGGVEVELTEEAHLV